MSAHSALFHRTAGVFQVPFISPVAAACFCFSAQSSESFGMDFALQLDEEKSSGGYTGGFTEVAPTLL